MRPPIEKEGHLRIRRDILKHARERMGLDQEALAEAVCLKSWHINQIEDTEDHYYFYTNALKINAVKKIGKYLELDESSFLY
jgi:ribosome-binding protein aMBF1 (putative translation factor)